MFSGDIVDRTAITRRLGLVFSDSDILGLYKYLLFVLFNCDITDRSFVSRENGKLKLADAHHDRIDFDELSQAYEILADHVYHLVALICPYSCYLGVGCRGHDERYEANFRSICFQS